MAPQLIRDRSPMTRRERDAGARVGHRRGQHQGRARRAATAEPRRFGAPRCRSRSSATRRRSPTRLLALARDARLGGGLAARRHHDGRAVAGLPYQARRRRVRARRDGDARSPATLFGCTRWTGVSWPPRRPGPARSRSRASNWAGHGGAGRPTTPGRDPGRHRHDLHRHHPDRRADGSSARGRTDPARLLTGELVYTGAVRTPAEALVREVPLWGGPRRRLGGRVRDHRRRARVARTLAPDDYTAPTAGRPAGDPRARGRAAGARRLRRPRDAGRAGDRRASPGTIAEAQVALVAAGLRRVHAADPAATTAVVTGLGDFIAADAARRAGLEVIALCGSAGGRRLAPHRRPPWPGCWRTELSRKPMSGGQSGSSWSRSAAA